MTSYRRPGVCTARTVIWFRVSVPVLSEQITVVLPSVSTAGSRRITARRRAIRPTPIASVIVTAAGSPSGIAPTASATAAMNISLALSPRARPITKVTAASATITTVSTLLTRASLRVSGVAGTSAPPTSRWISPSSVSAPVATVIPAPDPLVTSVPEYSMFRLSATGVSAGSTTSSLTAGTDSPVSADSSARSPVSRIRRRSAGTLSPASTSTRSPGTRSSEACLRARPSRTTVTWVRVRARSASRAPSARDSCTYPISVFSATTPKITAASTCSPSATVTAPAASST